MEMNKPESIWADGVPQKIDEKDRISNSELADMAITYIMKNIIIPKGFKIEQGFPGKEVPNIICKRDGIVYAIMVVPSLFPDYITINDEFRLKLVSACLEHNTVPLYAPIGYKSIDEERAKAKLALKGDVFLTSFPGFVKLTNNEKQDFSFTDDNLFRP